MYYLEDFEVGKTRESKEQYLVTDDEIMEMGRRWDPQPFHTDREFASNSIFGGLVACSAHLFAIFTLLGAHKLEEPTAAVSALGFDKTRLHAPVMAGDKISFKVTYLEVRPSRSRPGCGIVNAQNELFNQRKECVFSSQCAYLVLCRPNNDSQHSEDQAITVRDE